MGGSEGCESALGRLATSRETPAPETPAAEAEGIVVGTVRTTGRLIGPAGSADVEFVVDTGSTATKIDARLGQRLGLVPIGTDEVELADGTVVTWPVAEARLELPERPGRIVTIQCWITPQNGEALLGIVALEAMLLQVDPVRRRLTPVRGLAL